MRARRAIAPALVLLTAAACGGSTAKGTRALDSTAVPRTITVTSPEFANGRRIPRANTCDGAGLAPTIRWSSVPATTKSVAVVVDDPDASVAPAGSFLHWIVVGLAPTAHSVPSHDPGVNELDNAAGTRGWTPPCPPAGSTHHYRLSVYALNDYVCAANDDTSNGPGCAEPSSSEALGQILGAAIAKGLLTGTYSR
jgi:hypothetical protein